MKSRIDGEKPKFTPIELVITIESMRELDFFLGLFNTSTNKMNAISDIGLEDFIGCLDSKKGLVNTVPIYSLLADKRALLK